MVRSAVFALLMIVVGLRAASVHAETTSPPQPAARTVTATGSGEVSVRPDLASIGAGVVTEASSATQALAANSQAMTSVFKGLDEIGIDRADVQTAEFSIGPVYDQPRDPNAAAALRGYQVSNRISVLVRQPDRLGTVLDRLVAAGANRMEGIQFSVRDPQPMLDKARQAAVADALRKAKLYADAVRVVLGPVVSISEQPEGIPPPRPMFMKAMTEAVPVATGEQKLIAGVTLVLELR